LAGVPWYHPAAVGLTLTILRASFVFAVQTWLAQTPEQAKHAGTPAYLAAGMAR